MDFNRRKYSITQTENGWLIEGQYVKWVAKTTEEIGEIIKADAGGKCKACGRDATAPSQESAAQ